jgi:hypothetical protein
MNDDNPTFYVREMIQQFRMPGKDCINEYMFSSDKNSLWDLGIFISTAQSENFYTDIFQFWIRSLFCFFENMADYSTLQSVAPFVVCEKISKREFEQNFLKLISKHVIDRNAHFDVAEFQKLSFSKSYLILHGSEIESSVAELEGKFDGEYIAYFHQTKKCQHL